MAEPTREQLLALMHANERTLCESKDAPVAQCEAIFDFYRRQWKENHPDPPSAESEADEPNAPDLPVDWTSTRKQKPRTDDGETPIERYLRFHKNAQGDFELQQYPPPESDEDRRLRKEEELLDRRERLQRQERLENQWREMRQFDTPSFTPISEMRTEPSVDIEEAINNALKKSVSPPKQDSTLGEKLLLIFSGLGDVILALIGGTQAKLWVSLVMLVAACLIQILVIVKVQPFRSRKWNILLGFVVVSVLMLLWWGARPDVPPMPTPDAQSKTTPASSPPWMELVYQDFKGAYKDHWKELGAPDPDVFATKEVYQAEHERARVIWLDKYKTVYFLDTDGSLKWQPDPGLDKKFESFWENDVEVVKRFKRGKLETPPPTEQPPFAIVAKGWYYNDDYSKWRWIRWRLWHCILEDTVAAHLQKFERGVVIGNVRLMTAPHPYHAVLILLTDKKVWYEKQEDGDALPCYTRPGAPNR